MQRKSYGKKSELLNAVLKCGEMKFCEYLVEEDRLIFYDDTLVVKQEIPDYMDYLQKTLRHSSGRPLEDAGFLPGKDTGERRKSASCVAEKQCACCFGRFLWREWTQPSFCP